MTNWKLILYAFVLIAFLTLCFKQPSKWREKSEVNHLGRHFPVEDREWDTIILSPYTGRKLFVTAVEAKCDFLGCPTRDTFYIIHNE